MQYKIQENYQNFFIHLQGVCEYSIDQTLTSKSKRPYKISELDFFSKLYENRTRAEKDIKDFLNNSSNLLSIVGNAGAGKTTLGRKISNDLNNEEHFVLFMDMRADDIMDYKNPKDENEFKRKFLNRIKSEYKDRLFYYPDHRVQQNELKAKNHKYYELIAFILKRLDDSIKPRRIFHHFTDLQTKAAMIFNEYLEEDEINMNDGYDGYYDWIKKNISSDKEMRELVYEVDKTLQISHLVFAADYIYDFKGQYIWIDNIDALPEVLQPEAQSLIKFVHNRISDYAATIISMRTENIFRDHDFFEPTSPPFIGTVKLYLPESEKEEFVAKSLDLPHIDFKLFTKIVNNRVKLAINLTNEKNSSLTIDEQYAIEKVTDCLLEAMEFIDAPLLANNSLRHLLHIFSECLSYLFTEVDKDSNFIKAVNYDKWYIATLFLTWVRNSRNPEHRIGIYDIVDILNKWKENEIDNRGCTLDYLTINTVWNLTIENLNEVSGLSSLPFVNEIINRLKLLGYDEDDVKISLYRLYNQEGMYSSCLEIHDETDLYIKKWESIKASSQVRITPRGKVLAGKIGNTFGYLIECLRYNSSEYKEKTNPDSSIHPIIDINTALEYLIPELCSIGNMHLKEMEKILESELVDFELYLKYFGLPETKSYPKKGLIGTQINGRKYSLQFQSIIGTITNYSKVKQSKYIDYLTKLETEFNKSLKNLIDNQSYRSDFENIIDWTKPL